MQFFEEEMSAITTFIDLPPQVIGMTKMTPPIKDLLPRLTPILKNRHEKVQENCIDLVGRIADRGKEEDLEVFLSHTNQLTKLNCR